MLVNRKINGIRCSALACLIALCFVRCDHFALPSGSACQQFWPRPSYSNE